MRVGASAMAISDENVPLPGEAAGAPRRPGGGAPVLAAGLHERFASLVHGILLAYVRPGDAEDLAQDVFIQAMRRLPDLREESAAGPWLAAIARNKARDFLRARARRPALRLVGDEAAPGPSALSADDVMDAIRSLPEAYRETLVLRLVEGLTGPQIAERTAMTHGSVRVNLCRGMEMLREKLGVEGRA